MECRQRGLFDYQWCKVKDINLGAFYIWVSKLRKSGYTFLESKSISLSITTKQEIVKLNLIDHGIPAPVCHLKCCYRVPAWRHHIIPRLFNGTDISVVQSILQCIGGMCGLENMAPYNSKIQERCTNKS